MLFIFCIDFGNGKYAKQQNQQPSIQNGATAGKGNIQTRLADEQNAEQKIHFANLLEISRDILFFNIFQNALGIKNRLTIEGKNALGQRNKYLREIAASQRFLLLSDGANSCNTACFMVNLSNMWQKSVRAFVCSLVQAGLTVIRLLHPLLHLVFKIRKMH